ncbi:hypothetical protein [Novipirellula artificiosorum]|uniref:Uncharacterized protein n=1 Tax=Novipirellula artificiosorum TaxID=2528016 RepID=A0A5C6D1F7_9BACT|nr:hypothetical protein [Novipirellula artificiosorum]TWU29036.1 hypothetical protein Poly41_67350 [Novipirellula artificiosorum]
MLSLYYAEKLRGACKLAEGDGAGVSKHMEKAEFHWKEYSQVMHSMYKGMQTQRSITNLKDWHSLDGEVEAESRNVNLRN